MEHADKVYDEYYAQGVEEAQSLIDSEPQFYVVEDCYEQNPYACAYVGKVFDYNPSGKYYALWCTNVTEEEALHDEAFFAGFDATLDSKGWWAESGEGDPTDIFLCRHITDNEGLAYLTKHVELFLSKEEGFKELRAALWALQDALKIDTSVIEVY